MTNYYDVLELTEQASAADIRRAYLRLVRLTHPDRTPDPAAHRRYLLVNEAYDTLRQPALRAHHDACLRAIRQPPRPAPLAYTQPFGGNAYQVLRVPYSASHAQIDQAYQHWKRLLQRAPGADPAIQRQLADLEHAYATLHDAELRRRHHEQLRHQPPRAAGPAGWRQQAYARYAAWVRRWGRLPGLLPVVLWADYLLPGRQVQAQPILLQCQHYRQAFSCLLRTSHGSLLTPMDLPAGIDHYRLEVSWLFGCIQRAYLPSGQPLPVLHPVYATLAGLSLLVLLLAGLSARRQLSAGAVVNVGVGLLMATLLLLLMALDSASPY
ncbi:hypothetical protein GCM10027048_36680 [Hymenobacter coalescens]